MQAVLQYRTLGIGWQRTIAVELPLSRFKIICYKRPAFRDRISSSTKIPVPNGFHRLKRLRERAGKDTHMVVRRLSLYAAVTAACVVSSSSLFAQGGPTPDRAAGQMVDSLFEPNAPANLVSKKVQPPRRGIQRPSLQAKLVRNNAKDGTPAFALVDRYGGILRYVESVEKVKLEPYVGRIVGVRHDTGDTLLASQLILPPTTRTRPINNGVQQAAFQEPIPAGKPSKETLLEPTPADEPELADESGETYTFREGEEIYMGENAPMYEEGMDFGGCPHCESGTCSLPMGHGYRRGGHTPIRSRAYLHGEYLLWWFDGMNTPPLVTTSTNPADGGVLPNPAAPGVVLPPNLANATTTILYGDEPLLEDPRSGFRVLLGVWIDDCNKQAIEADYLFLGKLEETFTASGSDGVPIISRPFFSFFPVNGGPPQENAQEVSSDALDGSVTVLSESRFQGAGIRFRHNLCRSSCGSVGCGDCVDCGMGVGCGLGIDCGQGIGCGCGVGGCSESRYVDFLAGFRWYQLNERLRINEDLTDDFDTPNPADDVRILVEDLFETDNDFFGAELGYQWGLQRNRWTADLLTRVAIGNNHSRVRINGDTDVIDATLGPDPDLLGGSDGGLLALESNIGQYERDRFSMIPEVNLTLGYLLTQNLKFRVGYTVMYWTNVLRPGDQIDREINNTLLPLANVPRQEVPYRPSFTFHETNVLIQGLNIGGEYCW